MAKKRNRRRRKRQKNIESIDFNVSEEGHCILKLPNIPDDELPYVSIITPTRNRRFIFELTIHQFQNIMYPPERLEWVILDNGSDKIKDMLPVDPRIKYMTLPGDKRYSIADLRNHCIDNCSHDIIVYMDDDDYYPEESVYARVKALIKYKKVGVGCVGCTSIGAYHIIDEVSNFVTNGDAYLAEASMCHTKQFWNERKFNRIDNGAEYMNFIKNRQSKIRHIPFQFVCIALNHHSNSTMRGMKDTDEEKVSKRYNFAQFFSPEIRKIFYNVIVNISSMDISIST
tara:strand:+ start:119 stop:973 length:855 start_codon:yes stop_codon:yes gene_type:complete